MRVDVTAEHIATGWRCCPAKNPIALAVYGLTDSCAAWVDHANPTYVSWHDWQDVLHYEELPLEAVNFSILYNLGETVAPFSFDLP